LRIQRAIAVYTVAKENPQAFDQQEVYRRVFSMVGIEDIDALFNKNPQPAGQQDPAKMLTAQAALQSAQAKTQEVAIKAKTAQQDAATEALEAQAKQTDTRVKALSAQTEAENRAEDRRANQQIEMMRLQREEIIHNAQMQHERAEGGAQRQHEKEMQANEPRPIVKAPPKSNTKG